MAPIRARRSSQLFTFAANRKRWRFCCIGCWRATRFTNGSGRWSPPCRTPAGPASGAAMILGSSWSGCGPQPAAWVAVAAALFAERFDVVRLLEAIPPAAAQGWIREMEGSRQVPSRASTRIPRPAQDVHSAGTEDLRLQGHPCALACSARGVVGFTRRVGGRNSGLERPRSSSTIDFGRGNPPRRACTPSRVGPPESSNRGT